MGPSNQFASTHHSVSKQLNQNGSVAIIGMGCLFPQASSPHHLWRNVVNCVDALAPLSSRRLPPLTYHPRFSEGYRAGSIENLAWFDALRFKVMPITVSGTEPDQLLAL